METNVQEAVDAVINAVPDKTIRIAKYLELGQVIHQGDVYLHRVPENHPHGERLGTRQVAIGDTVGARHVVEGNVEVFKGTRFPDAMRDLLWAPRAPRLGELGPVDPLDPTQSSFGFLCGPLVVAYDSFYLTHPEHAKHELPAGVYQVTYQQERGALLAD
jgi:hypothetical protein